MTKNIVLTEDGSLTCRDPQSGELYHNRAGAYTEALYNYVKPCDLITRANKQQNIFVLDSCFGLGYNSFVLIDYFLRLHNENYIGISLANCHIIGIDKDKEIINLLPQVLNQKQFQFFCQTLNVDSQMTKQMVSDLKDRGRYVFNLQDQSQLSFLLEIKFIDLRQAILELVSSGEKFDYIFHDGFSPRVMPELWTVDLFQQYAKLLNESGRIITYSSAYAVRGALKECGLQVRKTIAVGGKSGGTIAYKNNRPEIVDNESIFFLPQEENDRLFSRSSISYRDPSLNDSGAQIVQRRTEEIKQSKLPVYKQSR